MSLLRKYFSSPRKDKILLLKAFGISLVVKIVVFICPLRWYSKYLDNSGRTFSDVTHREELIKSITRAVRRTSRYAPWKTKCLVDAITAKVLLQWHGIPSTLFLGVHKDKGKKLTAHAWLKCDDKFITGKRGYQKFIVVSSFA